MKPLVVKPPGMLPTLERKSILKAADSTVPLTDSGTDSLPSLPNKDDTIITSDDSGSQGTMLDGHVDEYQYRYNSKFKGEMYDLMVQDIANYFCTNFT